MDNKQLYIISNQQRFTFNSWKVIVPYSHVHFPVYLTNPYQLTYRRAGYIRAHSYNYSIGQQMFTFDMGVHLNPTLPNVGLYNQNYNLNWWQWWFSYPSITRKVVYEGNYNNTNLPYLPASKYHQYNNSGNRVFYDLMVHTLNRRYHNNSVKSYVTSGLDTIISTYTPLTAPLLSSPSCIYYLLSPQRYHTWLLTYKGRIKTPMIYLRSLLQEYLYTTLWSVNFAILWDKLSYSNNYESIHRKILTSLQDVYYAPLYTINSYLRHKYAAIMCNYPAITTVSSASLLHSTYNSGSILRIPITQSLTFLSSLQVSIPKKRLWGMGSWGVSYLEYYTPRITATMHGTGITSKLPINKYSRVTANGQGGRYLSSRLYKGLLVLPFTLKSQPSLFSYARILQFIAPLAYESGDSIISHQLSVYIGKQPYCTKLIKKSTLLNMWTNVRMVLYKHSVLRYMSVRVTYKQVQLRRWGKGNKKGLSKNPLLPRVNKLWYNRMLPKKT